MTSLKVSSYIADCDSRGNVNSSTPKPSFPPPQHTVTRWPHRSSLHASLPYSADHHPIIPLLSSHTLQILQTPLFHLLNPLSSYPSLSLLPLTPLNHPVNPHRDYHSTSLQAPSALLQSTPSSHPTLTISHLVACFSENESFLSRPLLPEPLKTKCKMALFSYFSLLVFCSQINHLYSILILLTTKLMLLVFLGRLADRHYHYYFYHRREYSDALLLEDADHSITSNRRLRLVAKQVPSADDRDYYYNGDDDNDNNNDYNNSQPTVYFRSQLRPDDDQDNRLTMSSPIGVATPVEETPVKRHHHQSASKRHQTESVSTSWRRRGGHRPAPATAGGIGGGGGRSSTRTAPRLSVGSRDAPVYTSTGSSTSGVDVSVSSSRSELIVQLRNGQQSSSTATRLPSSNVPLTSAITVGTALSVDADCEDNVDDEDSLSLYRSASFRRAIERGNSTGCGGGGSRCGSAYPLNGNSVTTQSIPAASSTSTNFHSVSASETKLTSAPLRTPSPRSSSLVKQPSNVSYPSDVLDLSSTAATAENDKNTTVLVGADCQTKPPVSAEEMRESVDENDEYFDSDAFFSGGISGLTIDYRLDNKNNNIYFFYYYNNRYINNDFSRCCDRVIVANCAKLHRFQPPRDARWWSSKQTSVVAAYRVITWSRDDVGPSPFP